MTQVTPDVQTSFAVLSQKVESIHQDFTEMRLVLRELTNAINKLTLIEERQSKFAEAQEKVNDSIHELHERVHQLEIGNVNNDRIRAWVDRGVLAGIGIILLFVAKQVGLV